MEIEDVSIKTEHLDEEEYCNIVELDLKEDRVELRKENPFKCGICGHRTTTDTLLKVHAKMHFVKRMHHCNICRRTFNFVSELNSHILTHTEDKTNFPCGTCGKEFSTEKHLLIHCQIHTADKVSVSARKGVSPKKFKNNPALPLNHEEKLLLLQHVEQLELNKKYQKLEQIKSYIRNSWVKMSELFAQNDYDRSPEKLTRTYVHLKKQAKTHIGRFYKDKKLPKPHKIDYMFVKLCPTDLDIPGIDIQQVLDDSKNLEKDGTREVKDYCDLPSEDDEDTEVDLGSNTSLNGTTEDPLASIVDSSNSQKRSLLEVDDGPPSKIRKKNNINESSSQDVHILKVKFLLAEEQRKDHLYKIELQQKRELFLMEKMHKEEIYQKELEIQNLKLATLTEKAKLCKGFVEAD